MIIMIYPAQVNSSEYGEETGKRQKKIAIEGFTFSGNSWFITSREETETSKQPSQGVSDNQTIAQITIPRPVYIRKVKGVEYLTYNKAMMEPNKVYDVVWNGENYGLMKTDKGVELLKVERDN
jgi:hypothetical protein